MGVAEPREFFRNREQQEHKIPVENVFRGMVRFLASFSMAR